MKIIYNSVYMQTETLNFTSAQQAIIVYFYLCSNFQEIAMPNAKLSLAAQQCSINGDRVCQWKPPIFNPPPQI